jgi:uncharacterized protein YjbJ (UPF0337 family)
MNSDVLEGKWKLLKDEVKMRWNRLTDEEIDTVAGRSDKLLGLLQQRYGYARDQADRELSAWLRSVQ